MPAIANAIFNAVGVRVDEVPITPEIIFQGLQKLKSGKNGTAGTAVRIGPSKFPMNIIRPSNAYCPGQLLHRVIPKTVVCALKGEKLPLHGGGRAEKSFIHARDLARAIYLVSKKAPLGKIYNVGTGRPQTVNYLASLIGGKKIFILPPGPDFVFH